MLLISLLSIIGLPLCNQSINPSVSLYHSTSDFNARGLAHAVISDAIFDPAIAAEKLRESFNLRLAFLDFRRLLVIHNLEIDLFSF